MFRQNRQRLAMGCELLEGRRVPSSLGQDIQQLGLDLQAIHAKSQVTPAEVKAVVSDFQAIGAVATKPSASSVAALKAEVQLVVSQKSITPAEVITLEKDINAVLASANVPSSLVKQTEADIHAVVVSSGVTSADIKQVAGDIKAIVADLQALKR